MAKKYYWLKLMKDFFQQPKIKKLRRVAGGDTYTVIYLKLQLLSLENGGKLYFEGVEDTFVEEIALTIDEDEDNVRFTLMYLKRQGLIEEVDENEFAMPEAMACIGSEAASTERSRRCRERKRQAALPPAPEERKALQCNADATESNASETKCNTDIDIEIDKDIDKDIEKEKEEAQSASAGKPAASPSSSRKSGKRTKADTDAILQRYTTDEKVLGLLRDWLKVRKAKRAPETEKALTLNLDKLESLSCESGLTIPAYLEAVIARGWAAFYPIREGIQQGQRPAARRQDERSRIKSEAEHAQGGHASGIGW